MRLEPPIEMDTPRGRALAFFRTDPSSTQSIRWGCCIKATGEWWEYENEHVLHAPCETSGIRRNPAAAAPGEAAQGGDAPPATALAPAPLAPLQHDLQPCCKSVAPAPLPANPSGLVGAIVKVVDSIEWEFDGFHWRKVNAR